MAVVDDLERGFIAQPGPEENGLAVHGLMFVHFPEKNGFAVHGLMFVHCHQHRIPESGCCFF